MSKLAFLTSGTGVTVGAGTALVGAIAVAGYVSGAFTSAPDATQVTPAVVSVQEAPKVAPESVDVAEAVLPAKTLSFDVVRVETNGAAMIAGRADAGSTIAIKLNESVVAEVKADGSGKFASFVTLPASEDAQVLTLESDEQGSASEQVIVAPIVASVPEPMAEVAIAEETVPLAEDVDIADPKEAATAPVVLLSDQDGVRVLQAPKPDVMTSLLGSISYDDAGDVALTGAASGEFVRVYLDNRAVATSQIAANGDWQAGLPSVDTGIYTLRVDELNAAGDVVARLETPFKREEPEVLAAATLPEKTVQAITVQPGATLWAIAQERYGSGTLYARLVEANADTIKDPDLIYPGQVFTVPD